MIKFDTTSSIKENTHMRYAMYCRVSSDREDRQVLGSKSQEKELLAYAKQHNLDVRGVFKEEKSAYKPGRPEFNKMIAMLQRGEANAVMVWHLTRVSRNSLDGGLVIHLMDEGIIKEIRTKDSVYRNTGDDKFFMQMHFAMSKKSSDDTSAFVKRDTITKLESGEFPGLVPEGYLNIKEGAISGKRYNHEKQGMLLALDRELKRIELDPILAPLYRKFFDLVLTGAYNQEQLRNECYKIGIRGKMSGKKLAKETLRKILNNRFYSGEFDYMGKVWCGTHEPIITPQEFEQIQEILAKRSHPKNKTNEYLLSTLIQCGECGHLLSGDIQKKTRYYRCVKAKGRNATCSNKKHYREDLLETQIINVLDGLHIPGGVIKWAQGMLQKAYKTEANQQTRIRVQNRKNIETAKKKLKHLASKWLSPGNSDGSLMSDDDYRLLKNETQVEIKRLEEQAGENSEEENDWIETCEDFFLLSRKIVSNYKIATISDKKTILNAIGSKFVLKGSQLSIKLNKPFSYVSNKTSKKEPIRTANDSSTMQAKPSSESISADWLAKVQQVRKIFVEGKAEPTFFIPEFV